MLSRRAAPSARRIWLSAALAAPAATHAPAASTAAFSTLARSLHRSRILPSISAASAIPSRLLHSSCAPSAAASSDDRLQAMMARVRQEREVARMAASILPGLRELNQQGQFARVVQIVEYQLTQEVAHDTRVAELYWQAKDAMEQQQQQQQQPPQPPPQQQQPQHSAPRSSSSSSIYTDEPSSPVLYMRRVGLDPAAGFRAFINRAYIGGPFAPPDYNAQLRWMLAIAIVGLTLAYQFMPKDLYSKVDGWAKDLDPSAAKKYTTASIPTTRLKDVCGCDEAKEEVAEVVEFLKNPDKFNRLGGKMPKGVLLLGPPGTGKTLLARAIAGEAGVPFFSVTGADFEQKYVGLGAKRMRELFEQARKLKRAIIFIDEIDTIGGKRDYGDFEAGNIVGSLNQLLTELDGFTESNGIIVIAATNYAERLDPALLRPGRFDRHVSVPVPDIKGRKEILDLYASKMKLDPAVDLNVIARKTINMTGADLFHLLNTAALRASALNQPAITVGDLEYAADKATLGTERTSGVMTPEMRRHLSFYHAGKVVTGLFTAAAPPLNKVTIVQRGDRLGLAAFQPGGAANEDKVDESYEEMLARLDLRMGGRAAEEIIYGKEEVTSQADTDLDQASRLARKMVMEWGFGAKHGPVSHDASELAEGTSYASKLSIDNEVRALLDASHARTVALLKKRQKELHRVAEALLKYEVLDANQMQQVLKGQEPTVPTATRKP